ncbi:hypothetical protein [Pyrobaculum neutrophilum]|uniref:Uncharacterized protein n=1 Tax=Pyrobaculum neutrophilum (strain DSM 2338 / JCM 9278 / NBRC 100436 / V24Sta) TaxID=444157 RepID=B1YCM5_PYRNV|nr:hypothetical protein [Pyrobaculum neutrophilum]ACB39538.1 conserved hypothetical protein [Pyrobaculum neutrophilum V24Sta]
MAEDFGIPEYAVEILAELRQLRQDVANLRREVAELSKKLAEPQARSTDADVALNALREAAEKLNAAAAAVVENASLIRAAVAEDRLRRDEACTAVLEKMLALQEALNKILK